MEAFGYANPKTLKEAFSSLGASWDDAAVLAGGTDLISLMKDRVGSPKKVVNIKGISELKGIGQSGGGVRIGAAVTLDELTSNATVRSQFPSLVQAALGVASPQIRNMGTVGGDLCQRPRCWYYRQGFGLLGMKDGNSLIPNGENKYHAIFGGGPAYFVSPSSFGPALVALGAKVKIASAKGNREVSAAEFFVSPKDASARETAIQPGEIVTEIVVPTGTKNATYEVRERDGLDWPLAAASVSLKMNGNKVSAAKIALGHVAPTPWAVDAAGASLVGKSIDEATAEAAGKAAVEGAKPLSQNEYKVQLAAVCVKRALLAAVSGKA
jgi:xanthine dehydrogenase YagS FAD-binding subunit